MSWQQVDLYLPELRPSNDPLTIKLAAAIVGCLIFALALLTWLEISHSQNLREETAAVTQQLADTKASINALQLTLPRSQAFQVQQEIDSLELVLKQRQRILNLIDQQNLGNSDGFSVVLEAMARQHRSDLAIEGFTLAAGGNKISFLGQAKSAAAIPQYIKRLQREAALDSVSFGDLVIEQTTPARVVFSLTHKQLATAAGSRR